MIKEQRVLRTFNYIKKNGSKLYTASNDINSNYRLNQIVLGRFSNLFVRFFYILAYLEIIIFRSLNILNILYLSSKKIKIMKEENFNLLIVEDILLLPIAFKISKKKIIFDAREYYLEQFRGEFFFEVILKPIYYFILKNYLKKCFKVFTVSNEIKKLYEKNYKIKVQVLYSTPYQNKIKINLNKNKKIKLIYCGIANRNRNLEILINLKKLLKNNYSINVMISNRTRYAKNLIHKLKLNKINIIKPVKYNSLFSSLSNFDVGLICYDPKISKNINYCMPNKLFEYLHSKIPVLSTPIHSVSKFIIKNNCGLVSKKFNENDLAKILISLNYTKLNNLKKKAFKVSKKFCFENESKKLSKYI